eukprot:Rhum_TRINITY_DN12837_c0_g2::Rhum_TRINITY_DN12837_c0_g2_i1::g.54675::m.54675
MLFPVHKLVVVLVDARADQGLEAVPPAAPLVRNPVQHQHKLVLVVVRVKPDAQPLAHLLLQRHLQLRRSLRRLQHLRSRRQRHDLAGSLRALLRALLLLLLLQHNGFAAAGILLAAGAALALLVEGGLRLGHTLLDLHLVVRDVALVPLHAVVVADPDFGRRLRNQTHVVRNQDDASLKLVQRLRQRVDGVHVQVVRRLVEEQDVRPALCHPRQHHAALHAVGQRPDLRRLRRTRDAEATHPRPHLLRAALRLRELLLHVLQRRQLHVQLVDEVLVEARHDAVAVALHVALRGVQLAGDQLLQRRLAGAVGADKADVAVQVDAEVQLHVQVVVHRRVAEGHVLELDDGRREVPRVREREGHLPVARDGLCQPAAHHLRKRLLLALRLAGKLPGSVTEAGDVVLHRLHLPLLPLPPLLLVLLLLLPRDAVLVVVSGVVLHLPAAQVNDVRADAVHKVLRVRHHQQDALERLQVVLQPHDGLDVEVVRRLVE